MSFKSSFKGKYWKPNIIHEELQYMTKPVINAVVDTVQCVQWRGHIKFVNIFDKTS